MDKEDIKVLPLAAVGLALGVYEELIRPNPAIVAWATLASGIVAYDTWAIQTEHETMSHAYHRGVEHPIMKFACIGAIGAIALHLGHGTK